MLVGDVADLAKQIAILLEHPELVQEVGRQARLHIAKHYDWKEIAETTEYLYELIQLEEPLLSKKPA